MDMHKMLLSACFIGLYIQVPVAKAWIRSPHFSLHSRVANMERWNEQQLYSQLTDWVIEGLEDDGSSITSSSETMAGENDNLPLQGLCIGNVRILAADAPEVGTSNEELLSIRLLLGRNGWGTGVHPSTRLCLEWLSRTDVMQPGLSVLDYGCGSGILSLAALKMGASKAIGVDVEAEALITTERNMHLNGIDAESRFEGWHTREVVPYGLARPDGADLCVANILVGQLVRPSMVSTIVSNVALGGLVCFSGIRPDEVSSLKEAYGDHMECWMEEQYGELAAVDTENSIESYGFDVGTWARLVGKIRRKAGVDIEAMSELAVS